MELGHLRVEKINDTVDLNRLKEFPSVHPAIRDISPEEGSKLFQDYPRHVIRGVFY